MNNITNDIYEKIVFQHFCEFKELEKIVTSIIDRILKDSSDDFLLVTGEDGEILHTVILYIYEQAFKEYISRLFLESIKRVDNE